MSLFFDDNQNPRSGWKFLAYIGFFLIIWVATGLALSSFVIPRTPNLISNELFILALNGIALFVPAVLAMCLTIKFIDHRPLRAFGIGFLPGWQRQFLVGLAIAAGMLAVVVAGCFAFGYVSIRW